QRALEAALERAEALTGSDVEVMAGWPPRDRVVLGCLSGLWRKVPASHWDGWVSDFRAEYGFPAAARFPPAEFEQTEDVNERTAALARLLGQRLNTIRVWIHRGRERLWQLAYVRDRLSSSEDHL